MHLYGISANGRVTRILYIYARCRVYRIGMGRIRLLILVGLGAPLAAVLLYLLFVNTLWVWGARQAPPPYRRTVEAYAYGRWFRFVHGAISSPNLYDPKGEFTDSTPLGRAPVNDLVGYSAREVAFARLNPNNVSDTIRVFGPTHSHRYDFAAMVPGRWIYMNDNWLAGGVPALVVHRQSGRRFSYPDSVATVDPEGGRPIAVNYQSGRVVRIHPGGRAELLFFLPLDDRMQPTPIAERTRPTLATGKGRLYIANNHTVYAYDLSNRLLWIRPVGVRGFNSTEISSLRYDPVMDRLEAVIAQRYWRMPYGPWISGSWTHTAIQLDAATGEEYLSDWPARDIVALPPSLKTAVRRAVLTR